MLLHLLCRENTKAHHTRWVDDPPINPDFATAMSLPGNQFTFSALGVASTLCHNKQDGSEGVQCRNVGLILQLHQ